MRILQGHQGGIRAVAFAPVASGGLASAGDDGLVRVWDPARGTCEVALSGHRDQITSLGFSSDGQWLASGDRQGVLHAWNIECACSLNQIHFFGRAILHLAFAAHRHVVLAVMAQGKVRSPETSPLILWDPANHAPEQIDLWITAHRVALAPVGQVLVLAGASKDVLIVQLGVRRSQTTLAFPEMVTALAFGPAHNPLLAVAWGNVVELRDGKTYHRRITCQGHRSVIHTIAFAPDGNTVLTGSADETVRAWDTRSGAARGDWKWDLGAIQSVSVAADGMTAAAGGERSDLLVWDLDGV